MRRIASHSGPPLLVGRSREQSLLRAQLSTALAAGDSEAAAQAMRAHLESAKRILLEMTERR